MEDKNKNNQITTNNQSVVIDDSEKQLIGQRIKIAAKNVGGQKELSKRTGISDSQMGRYVKGTSEQSGVKLLNIAKATGVPLEWLLTGKGADGELVIGEEVTEYLAEATTQSLITKFCDTNNSLKTVLEKIGYEPTLQMQETIKTMLFSEQLTEEGLFVLVRSLKTDSEASR